MSIPALKWATKERFQYIENQAYWFGGLNRGDLTSRFGISVPQASKDLSQYQTLCPDNIQYDHSEKRYFVTTTFNPNFIDDDPIEFLERVLKSPEVGIDAVSAIAQCVPAPHRLVSSRILQAIVQAISKSQSVEILYQSMNPQKPDPLWRRITPHSFATDGMRWHTRAYCHVDQKFKDFLLSRCKETRQHEISAESIDKDKFWNEYLNVKLAPNSELSRSQQDIVAGEYGMENDVQMVPVRKAMLYYFEKRLRLDVADDRDYASEAPVIIENREEFDRCLREVTA